MTIVLGLASRRYGSSLPFVLSTYAGDTLWATMVFWLSALLRPSARTPTLGLIALGVAFGVEVSQLYHAPWIDSVRATRLGALVLGQGFLWSDLVCYAAGVVIAVALDRLLYDVGKRSGA